MRTLTLDDEQLRLITGLVAEYAVNQYRQARRTDFTPAGREQARMEGEGASKLLDKLKGRNPYRDAVTGMDERASSRFDAALRSLS